MAAAVCRESRGRGAAREHLLLLLLLCPGRDLCLLRRDLVVRLDLAERRDELLTRAFENCTDG